MTAPQDQRDALNESDEPTVCVVCGIELPDDKAAIAHLSAALFAEDVAPSRLRTPPPVPDLPSEYGRLLAERDRLISEGVDPAELDLPMPPPVPGEGE